MTSSVSLRAHGQTHTLKGHIYDRETEAPLSDVYIRTTDSTVNTTSDEKGYFEINPRAQQGKLHFSLMGYKNQTINFDQHQRDLNIYLSPENYSLNTVMIKSFNSNKKNKETPGAIAVISKKRINQGSGVSLQSSLNSVPGVQMDQSNLADSRISIRGNGIRSPWGIRNTKVYIEGIPVTETDGTTRIEALDVGDLGRAEVIRGPASSIYGGNTTGGVINFELQSADYGQKTAELEGMAGSYGLHRIASSYKSGTDNMNSFIAYGWQEYDGYRKNSWDMRRFIAGNFQFDPSEKQTLTLLVNRTSEDSRIPGLLNKTQVREDRRQAAPEESKKKAGRYQRWTRIGLGQKYKFDDRWTNSTSVFGYFYNLHHPLSYGIIRNTYQSYGGRTRFTFKPGFEEFDTKFITGVEFNQAGTKGTTYANLHGKEGDLMSNVDYKNTYYTLFYHSETKLTPKATFTVGMSYNNLKYKVTDFMHPQAGGVKNFDGNFAPRVALSHNFNQYLSLHGSVSKGFSAPTTTEISNADQTLNHRVGAEKALNYEIDAKGSFFNSRLSYDLSAYLMNMKGELIGQNLSQGITVYHNSGRTRHQGIELAAEYQVFKNRDQRAIRVLNPYLSLTYSHFKFTDYKVLDENNQVEADFKGNKLAGIAPWAVYVGMNVETRWGGYLSGNFRFNDKYALNDANTDYNSSYRIFNGKIGYKTTLGGHFVIDLYAGVNNIGNEKYSSFTAINAKDDEGGPAYFNPSPGINGFAGLALKYNF